MDIPKIIINNVRKTNLIRRIKALGVEATIRISDEDFKQWLDDLIDSGKILESDLNDCFFEELKCGYRRLMRVYRITNTRHMRREEDWQRLIEAFDCPSFCFNDIITTTVTTDEKMKIAAIRSHEEEGRIKKVEIMFLYRMNIKKREEDTISTTYSYIPVEIDLDKKIVLLKVWNKEEALEGDKPAEQFEKVLGCLVDSLGVSTVSYVDSHQRVLFKMSKALFDDFFRELPNYDSVVAKKSIIPSIVDSLISELNLENYEYENGLSSLNKEIIDIDEEVYKLLQQIALLDYLSNNEIDHLLSNTDKYISKIRFSDRDNLTASLMAEAGEKCIFDAQTFMCVRNSLDIVEKIVAIVVNYSQTSRRGKMFVKYDAATNEYLTVHIINDCYYTCDDFVKFRETYERYESSECIDGEIRTLYQEDDVEAM